MEYPYDQSRPDKQFAMVFDINRCVGCQTCTMSCKSTWTFNRGQEYMWWNNVETKPYGNYPQGYDKKILGKLGIQRWENGTYKGKTIFEAAPEDKVALGYKPSDQEWRSPNIYEDTATGWNNGSELPEHLNWMFYLARICNHCSYPACLAACPRKAIYKRKEDGIVLIDQKRCGGFKRCVEACPYKKAMYRLATSTSEKCIGCYPRLEENMVTRCVSACVGKIRLFGYLNNPDNPDPSNPLDNLVHIKKVALPLFPQLGTQPNVYYIPPRWVSRKFLKQMFGPGVENAIKQKLNPDDTLMGIFRLFGMTQTVINSFEVQNGEVAAFDAQGNELFKVKLTEEPMYVRPWYDDKHDAYRFNEP